VPGIIGTLGIDLSAPYIGPVGLGTVPASGVHVLGVAVPSNPSLIGQVLFTQPLRIGTGGIELDNWISLPFTP
jgi:hypothetical protein